ncbi:hypothetical protein BASA50_007569 [Batrachochytrium salamandrivorans]|uniref:Uncharacterized protein n=1 Tax=Batrachochytrium salamandrivorans TaxID=1357716 RepID=A0ABQ8F752_9FUNG|nr:hypothetical protein BASA50_010955 [Batrachochytrium salamandrivorans]KAH6593361.1 hypothetical protein BASA50_007569 [Batrachochytrium salamandrivorans]
MTARLVGKTVLITGTSAGIGEACAREFANAGSNLILTARRTDRLQTLADGFAKDFPSIKVLLLTMDVRNCSQVFDAIKHLPVGFRGIDVLVNSAGLAVGVDQLDKVTPEAIDSMFDTNVKGLMNVTQAVLPIMKGAQLGLHYQRQQHLWHTASVDPGLVETEFSMMRFGGDKDKAAAPYKGLIPLTGQDIAESIVFIASRRPHVQISHMQILPTSQASVTLINREQQ